MNANPPLYGVLAEFEDADALVAAAHRVREAGYLRTDAYAPYPVKGLAEALGMRGSRVRLVVLIGGIAGFLTAVVLQYYVSVVAYPLNVGGRPLASWPAFVPVTFELTILVAGLSAVLGMLALNGLPRPHHPLFGVERFADATRDAFFLCIESRDEKFDPEETRKFLESLNPRGVTDVPETSI